MPADKQIIRQLTAWRDQARTEGVRREENLPFFIEGLGEKRSQVLLVHGFTASPWEMRAPAEHLAARGHDCLAVRLPGHGTTPEDLRGRSWQEWLKVVERGAELLLQTGGPVDAAGSSTGALLLLHAARDFKLNRLVLFSPYLRVRHKLAPLAGLLKHFRPFQEQPKKGTNAPYFYARRPLAGVEQINLLRAVVRDRLADIQQPCLVLCSSGDQTVDPASAEELCQMLGSEEKEFHRYGEEVPHVLTIDENPRLADSLERMGRFLDK